MKRMDLAAYISLSCQVQAEDIKKHPLRQLKTPSYCPFLCLEKQTVGNCPVCSTAKLSTSLGKEGNIKTGNEFQTELSHPFLETLQLI